LKLWARRTAIAACRSFDDLLAITRAVVGIVHGAGPLLAYDTALRLGAQAGHRPERVYLHAGVRAGASNLGYSCDREFIEMNELPPEFQMLLPEQVEDILCIFKDDLRRFRVLRD
jgi:hypothetical protein